APAIPAAPPSVAHGEREGPDLRRACRARARRRCSQLLTAARGAKWQDSRGSIRLSVPRPGEDTPERRSVLSRRSPAPPRVGCAQFPEGKENGMRRMIGLASMIALGFCLTTARAEEKTPDATLKLSGGSVAAGVGVSWGSGTLTYKG